MGQAVHRKHIPVRSSSAKTPGTGYRYTPPPASQPKLTPEDIVAIEQQAARKKERLKSRQAHIGALIKETERILRVWQSDMDVPEQTVEEAMNIARGAAIRSCVDRGTDLLRFMWLLETKSESGSLGAQIAVAVVNQQLFEIWQEQQ
jgi:hypothetical protein